MKHLFDLGQKVKIKATGMIGVIASINAPTIREIGTSNAMIDENGKVKYRLVGSQYFLLEQELSPSVSTGL